VIRIVAPLPSGISCPDMSDTSTVFRAKFSSLGAVAGVRGTY
jgi:hypothetical protein